MKNNLEKLNKSGIEPVLSDVKKTLRSLYGEQLQGIILFGSYARGEATEHSDIDLLVLLKKHPVAKFREIRKMGDMIFDVLMKHRHLIGVVPASEKEWKTATSALYRNVKKEGIPI